MERDFKAQIQLQIRLANERGAEAYRGHEWSDLTPEEEQVFAINRARFPAMVTVWSAYEHFMGLVDEANFSCDHREIERERNRRADIVRMGVSVNGFQQFAKEYAGMTFREAHAMYCKHEFWQVRNGISRYSDEFRK